MSLLRPRAHLLRPSDVKLSHCGLAAEVKKMFVKVMDVQVWNLAGDWSGPSILCVVLCRRGNGSMQKHLFLTRPTVCVSACMCETRDSELLLTFFVFILGVQSHCKRF